MTSTGLLTIEQSSSITKLSSRPHTLRRKTTNVCGIPTIDLTVVEALTDEEQPTDIIVGIFQDYLDHGDQTVICELCHAKLWRDEALRGRRCGMKTSYSLCCLYGKLELPKQKEMPATYTNLFRCIDSKSKYFPKNIHRYNAMFSFTLMGGKVDSSINRGNAPYIYRLGGQNYHRMGSLVPPSGLKPKFLQLYIYDTEYEISNRHSVCREQREGSTSNSEYLDVKFIQYLKNMLDSQNVLVKSYRMERDCFQSNPN
ncbi:hypothetical protein OSB04_016746 [Centaurea solstitialis]|uniref:Uncharacterized protein n=1 Tax=Centaurea solstitialis TaxID=347529 RepID=A0AA38TCL7_9ASTR|nr:hypothetical protein OSB04_016746 [Centaurea solstitialis]